MKSARVFSLAAVVSLSLSSYACGGDDSSNGVSDDAGGGDATSAHDASHDATADASLSSDAGVDASQDASTGVDAAHDGAVADSSVVDAAHEASADAAVDAALDAAQDAEIESGVDAASEGGADAAPDAAPDGGTVAQTVTVVRVGDGTAALTSASTAVFLEKRNVAGGALVGAALALPIAANGVNKPLTTSGSATSEGELSRSVDGHFVVLAGYASAPGTASIASTASATVNRVVARVDSSGTIDTSTSLSNAFDGNNPRAAATQDGTAFWLAGSGATGGIEYAALGAATATQVLTTPSSTRYAGIFGGQLFATSASTGFFGVFSVGTGLPTMTGQTATIVPGFPTTTGPSPYSFVAFDLDANVTGIDRIYVADDRAASASGGIQKWTSNGTTWTLASTFTGGLTTGVRGVTAFVVGTNVTIVATTTETSANTLVSIVDDGTANPTATVLATAGANTVFRGVALSPTP